MTYRELLQAISQFSKEDLDKPVIVSVGKDDGEIAPVENLGKIPGEFGDDGDFLAGNPYLQIT